MKTGLTVLVRWYCSRVGTGMLFGWGFCTMMHHHCCISHSYFKPAASKTNHFKSLQKPLTWFVNTDKDNPNQLQTTSWNHTATAVCIRFGQVMAKSADESFKLSKQLQRWESDLFGLVLPKGFGLAGWQNINMTDVSYNQPGEAERAAKATKGNFSTAANEKHPPV